jgi:hypothetical protein
MNPLICFHPKRKFIVPNGGMWFTGHWSHQKNMPPSFGLTRPSTTKVILFRLKNEINSYFHEILRVWAFIFADDKLYHRG